MSNIGEGPLPAINPEGEPPVIDLRETVNVEPTGLAFLEHSFGHDPEVLAANSALALILALDDSDTYMATGRDTKLIGVGSSDLTIDLLQELASPQPRHSGYRMLFEELAEHYIGKDKATALRSDLAYYATERQQLAAMLQAGDKDYTLLERLNLRPFDLHLSVLCAGFLGRYLDTRRLYHEGGNPQLEPELYMQFCEKYQKSADNNSPNQKYFRQAVSGQVRSRLMKEPSRMSDLLALMFHEPVDQDNPIIQYP